jgi:hypothetical protein
MDRDVIVASHMLDSSCNDRASSLMALISLANDRIVRERMTCGYTTGGEADTAPAQTSYTNPS